jgi:hypothetical protein
MNIDLALEKWSDTRKHLSELEKKVDKYRKWVISYLEKNGLTEYENNKHKVKKQSQQRTFMYKKSVPADVWASYATSQKVDCILLKDKMKKSHTI